MQQRTKVEKRHSRKAEKRRREAEHEARAGGVGAARPAPPHRPLPAGHPLHGLDVVDRRTVDAARQTRRLVLLAKASEAARKAEETKDHQEKDALSSETRRLRGLADSELAHAEADAAEADYSDEIQSLGHQGQLWLAATNPATGHRLAWPAGSYKGRSRKQPRTELAAKREQKVDGPPSASGHEGSQQEHRDGRRKKTGNGETR